MLSATTQAFTLKFTFNTNTRIELKAIGLVGMPVREAFMTTKSRKRTERPTTNHSKKLSDYNNGRLSSCFLAGVF